MRVVLLTAGGYYGRWVAEGLRARGVPIAAVAVDLHVPALQVALRNPRRVLGVGRRFAQALPMRRFGTTRFSRNLNRLRGVAMLRRLEPDVLVLAGARILSEDVLATARYGVLNGHPARVPLIRGTGVVGWSILRGEPVTATVHFAVPDVDAGPVVHSELVPVHDGETLAEIEDRADRMCADLLADVVARAWREEELPRRQGEPSGEVFRWLTGQDRERCEALVAAGEAARLYREAAARG